MNFLKAMIELNIINIVIIVVAIINVILLLYCTMRTKVFKDYFEKAIGKELKEADYYELDRAYTLFITIISIFPLLGMFGTVVSLIDLGSIFETANDMSEIKSEFFLALTSTAWGIIFSVIFKIVNSFNQTKIENQLEKAKENLKI